MMSRYILSDQAEATDWIPVCMAIHEMVGKLPVTARSLEKRGIRIEDGVVVDDDYSGPILEEVLAAGRSAKLLHQQVNIKGSRLL